MAQNKTSLLFKAAASSTPATSHVFEAPLPRTAQLGVLLSISGTAGTLKLQGRNDTTEAWNDLTSVVVGGTTSFFSVVPWCQQLRVTLTSPNAATAAASIGGLCVDTGA